MTKPNIHNKILGQKQLVFLLFPIRIVIITMHTLQMQVNRICADAIKNRNLFSWSERHLIQWSSYGSTIITAQIVKWLHFPCLWKDISIICHLCSKINILVIYLVVSWWKYSNYRTILRWLHFLCLWHDISILVR